MSGRREQALTRWLLGAVHGAAELAARHETAVEFAVAIVIAGTSFLGLAVQGRLRHTDTIVFCVALCAPLLLRRRSRAICFALVAGVALGAGRIDEARAAFGAALQLARRIGHRAATAEALEGLAEVADREGDAEAAVLAAEAASLRAVIGIPRAERAAGHG